MQVDNIVRLNIHAPFSDLAAQVSCYSARSVSVLGRYCPRHRDGKIVIKSCVPLEAGEEDLDILLGRWCLVAQCLTRRIRSVANSRSSWGRSLMKSSYMRGMVGILASAEAPAPRRKTTFFGVEATGKTVTIDPPSGLRGAAPSAVCARQRPLFKRDTGHASTALDARTCVRYHHAPGLW